MAVPSTNADAMVSALATRIEAITPTAEAYQAHRWRYFPDFNIVGSEIRSFTIIADPETVVPEGIWGADGVEYEMETRIVTTYQGVEPRVARRLAGSDGKDLWVCLFNSVPLVTGMLPFPRNFIPEGVNVPIGDDDDDNERVDWIFQFIFPVRFKGTDTVTLAP